MSWFVSCLSRSPARVRGPPTATTCGSASSTPSWTSWRRRARSARRCRPSPSVPASACARCTATSRTRTSCSATRPGGSTGGCSRRWTTGRSTCHLDAGVPAPLWVEFADSLLAVHVQHSTPEGRQMRMARLPVGRAQVDRGLPPTIQGQRRADVVDLIVALCSSSMFLELVDRMGHDPVEAADLVADLVELIIDHEAGRPAGQRREHHDMPATPLTFDAARTGHVGARPVALPALGDAGLSPHRLDHDDRGVPRRLRRVGCAARDDGGALRPRQDVPAAGAARRRRPHRSAAAEAGALAGHTAAPGVPPPRAAGPPDARRAPVPRRRRRVARRRAAGVGRPQPRRAGRRTAPDSTTPPSPTISWRWTTTAVQGWIRHHQLHGSDLGPIGDLLAHGTAWGLDPVALLGLLHGASPRRARAAATAGASPRRCAPPASIRRR